MEKGKQFAEYDPKTMGTPGKLTAAHMAPGTSEAPDWDTYYGKAFRWGYIPKENWIGDPKEWAPRKHAGLIANFGPDFHDWEDASGHPMVQDWKQNWAEKWKTIPSYKQNQILAAVKATKDK